MRYSLLIIALLSLCLYVTQGSRSLKLSGGQQLPSFTHKQAHVLSTEDCLDIYDTNIVHGLSTEQALIRLDKYGENVILLQTKDSLFKLFIEQFQDRLVQILLSIAIFSSFLAYIEKDYHAFAEPIIILTILIINAIVGVYHAKSAEASLDGLKQVYKNMYRYIQML